MLARVPVKAMAMGHSLTRPVPKRAKACEAARGVSGVAHPRPGKVAASGAVTPPGVCSPYRRMFPVVPSFRAVRWEQKSASFVPLFPLFLPFPPILGLHMREREEGGEKGKIYT